LFTTKGQLEYDRLLLAFKRLCEELSSVETDESVWQIGEFEAADLGSLLVGTYWFLSDYHSGQDSEEYEALCDAGDIYSPNMATGPEPDSSEELVYQAWEDKIKN